MNFRTQLAAAASVVLLVGLAACGDDDNETASPTTPDTVNQPVGGSSSGSASDASASPSSDHSDHAMITMTDNKFSPANLTVEPGAVVMVGNAGQATHDLKDEKTKGKEFDSGDLTAGEQGEITAPDKAGEYPYYCTYHFGMTGTLTVE
ncbi:cupredoxin domain-containing protein [Sporichthya polymorpha]|uniref:cupredoxin domain-containing protein n=1 Tax=Sporichthya polymorpha TaxID=35751 RepID=UPI000374BDDB|nr:cupredoxin domain-containing protein [Sporichthya polymorpha]